MAETNHIPMKNWAVLICHIFYGVVIDSTITQSDQNLWWDAEPLRQKKPCASHIVMGFMLGQRAPFYIGRFSNIALYIFCLREKGVPSDSC